MHAEKWYIGVCLRVEFYGCAVGVSTTLPSTTLKTQAICTEFRFVNVAVKMKSVTTHSMKKYFAASNGFMSTNKRKILVINDNVRVHF